MAYTKTSWQNLPNQTTPLNANNLNKIENELENLDNGQVDLQEQLDDIKETIDFTNEVTFNETPSRTHTYFRKKENLVFVTYQGENKSHTPQEVIAVIPEEYRPTVSQIWTPATISANAATLYINSDGELILSSMPSATVSGRIYANFSYFLD